MQENDPAYRKRISTLQEEKAEMEANLAELIKGISLLSARLVFVSVKCLQDVSQLNKPLKALCNENFDPIFYH